MQRENSQACYDRYKLEEEIGLEEQNQ